MFEKMNSNSIRFRVTSAVAGIAVLLLLISFICCYSTVQMIRSQVYNTYQSILGTYIHGLENNLSDVESFLASRTADTSDFLLIRKHDDRWSLATSRQQEDLTNAVLTHSMADGFFIYEPVHDVWVDATASNYDNWHRLAVRSFISENISEAGVYQQLKSWGSAEIEGEYVFFRIIRVQGCYIGAWVKAETITDDFGLGDFSNSGFAVLADSDGSIYHNMPQLQGLNLDPAAAADTYRMTGDFLTVAQQSARLDIYLVVMLRDSVVLEGMGQFYIVILLLSIFAAFSVAAVVYATYRYFLKPFGKLTRAMQILQGGDWNVRLPEETELDEFSGVYGTFNHMVEQVEELKIGVYEQKLEMQNIENQMLKQQIAPHTFINCLNTIHGLAGTGKTEQVQQMAEDLGRHLRYILAASQTVHFEQDLEHARNYIALCNIRYGNTIFMEEEIDDVVLSTFIPPMLVQSFVENSVKYALSPERDTLIQVKAWREAAYLRLQMRDNGPGYSREMLDRLSSPGDTALSTSGHRIGLMNLRRRTVLMYGENNVQIRFSNNSEGGAFMDVTIPYQISGVKNI